jgi:MFS transporter, ACS family, glucarate transporter
MPGKLQASAAARPIRVRWIIFALLVGFSFLAYVQRTGITVVSKGMMSDSGLTQIQIGWALTSFLVSYTILQLPGSIFGEWAGARRTFAVITLLAVIATITIALAPLALRSTSLYVALLGSCLVLGVAQAPIFPVSSGVIEVWFPTGRWGTPQGLLTAAAQLGSAAAAPLTAWLVQTVGWKLALIFPGVPALVLIGFWFWYGRDFPVQHRSVSAAELAELGTGHSPDRQPQIALIDVLRVLRDRNILLLSVSYLCMNYVFYLISFWCFLYLVEQRHFSILEGGWLASLPYLGAAVGGVVGGIVCDWLCTRWGVRLGFRLIPLVALPIGGLLLWLAVYSGNGYEAVAALAFAFASIELTEGPFLAAATTIARQHTMAATAVINTGGNVGGIIATPIVAALSAHAGWKAAFVTGSAFALVSAFLWLFVDSSQPLAGSVPAPNQWTPAREPG